MSDLYPKEIVSNTSKITPQFNNDSLLIRGVESITSDDIYCNELIPSFVEKIVAPFPVELRRLSVSLLGDFKPEYIRFTVHPDDYWDKKTDISLDTISFTLNKRVPVYLSVKHLQEAKILVKSNVDNKEYNYQLIIKWFPTNSNFYHYELRIKNLDTGKVTSLNNTSKSTKEIATKLSNDIIYDAIDQYKTILSDLY